MYQMGIFAGEVGHIFALANTTHSGEFQKSAKKSGFRQIEIERRKSTQERIF